jgi:hypothetical protein
LRRYVEEIWCIPTDHFDPAHARTAGLARRRPVPLELVLVSGSNYSRRTLKERLYNTGLKARRCEACGQGEEWRGARISLILDHVNGIADDNRLENLRIVCPNCAATLDTHCGRKNRLSERACARCAAAFMPRSSKQRYCSQYCGMRHSNGRRKPKPTLRKVERPPYEQLMADVAAMGFSASGRKYGVSDNAVRKWIRWYEYQHEMEVWREQESQAKTNAV